MARIRKAALEDVPDIYRIWVEGREDHSYPVPDIRDYFADFIRNQDEVFLTWVTEKDGKVEGWCSLRPMRDSPTLTRTMAEISVYMSGEVQNEGYGARLMQHALDYAASTTLEWIWGFAAKSDPAGGGWRLMLKFGAKQLGELEPVGKYPGRETVLVGAIALRSDREGTEQQS